MLTRQTYTNEATGAVERWSATKRCDGAYDVVVGFWDAAPQDYWEPPSSAAVLLGRLGERGALIVQIEAPLDLTQTQMARARVAVKREFRALVRAEIAATRSSPGA